MAEPYQNYIANRHGALLTSMVGAALATMPRHEGVLRGSDETKKMMHSLLEQLPEQIFESGEAAGTIWSALMSAEGNAKTFLDQIFVQLTMSVLWNAVCGMQRVLTESCKKRRVKDIEPAVNMASQPDEQENSKSPWDKDTFDRTFGTGNKKGAASSADSKIGGIPMVSLPGNQPSIGGTEKQHNRTHQRQ